MKKNLPINIPNLLSITRIVLTPFVVLSFFYCPPWIFVLLFAITGSTDFFDGLIARRFNQETKIGIVLDVVADKLLVLSVFVVFVFHGDLQFAHFLLMSSREIVVIVGKFALYSEIKNSKALTDIPPSKLSKFTTLIFFVTAAAIVLDWNKVMFIWISIFLSMACSIQYLYMGIQYFKSKK